jgi:hypothetical protein
VLTSKNAPTYTRKTVTNSSRVRPAGYRLTAQEASGPHAPVAVGHQWSLTTSWYAF